MRRRKVDEYHFSSCWGGSWKWMLATVGIEAQWYQKVSTTLLLRAQKVSKLSQWFGFFQLSTQPMRSQKKNFVNKTMSLNPHCFFSACLTSGTRFRAVSRGLLTSAWALAANLRCRFCSNNRHRSSAETALANSGLHCKGSWLGIWHHWILASLLSLPPLC